MALIFLLIAILSAAFGFSGLAADSVWIAQTLVLVFLILAVVSAIAHLARGQAPPSPL